MINYSTWCFWSSYHLNHSNVPTISVINRTGTCYLLHASNREDWEFIAVSLFNSTDRKALFRFLGGTCSFFVSVFLPCMLLSSSNLYSFSTVMHSLSILSYCWELALICWYYFSVFFKLLFSCPMINFGLLLRGNLHLMLITVVLHIWPEGHKEPCNEVGSLNLVKCLVGFKLGTFWFCLQYLNALGYSRSFFLSYFQMFLMKTMVTLKIAQKTDVVFS